VPRGPQPCLRLDVSPCSPPPPHIHTLSCFFTLNAGYSRRICSRLTRVSRKDTSITLEHDAAQTFWPTNRKRLNPHPYPHRHQLHRNKYEVSSQYLTQPTSSKALPVTGRGGLQEFPVRDEHRRMASSAKLRRVALVRTDVSEELSAYFIRATKIVELGKTIVVTSTRCTLSP
jgi:hypothetical protein